MTLDKTDIQGGLLRGYTFPCVAHLFFAIEDVARTRTFLRGLEVARATPWTHGSPSTTVNVSFSASGLTLLAAPGTGFDLQLLAALKQRYRAFAEGMLARADQLGDAGLSLDPDWHDAHMWLSVGGRSQAELDARLELLQAAAQNAARLLFQRPLRGNALERDGTRCEHFGFQDNISNPEIEGAREPGEKLEPLNLGSGKRDADGTYAPIRAGEFLLGHPNESSDALPDDALARFVFNGSFAVFRDLKQDVLRFRCYLAATASALGRSEEEVGALIVGRHRDGRPLADAPEHDPSLNDFGYRDDREGARCPLASHVRRTHPRDASGVVEVSHRLLRRGMPYGPMMSPQTTVDDGIARGLYFVVFNADLERQFEFVQRNWVNAPTGTGLFDDLDPLVGRASSDTLRMLIPGSSERPLPRLIDTLPEFVRFQGGGYFFMPGIRALTILSGGETAGMEVTP